MVILLLLLLTFPAYADWIEVEVNKSEVFVQEQVIYTLRLYREPSLHRGYFNNFEKGDFISEILEDKPAEEIWLNDKRYFLSQRKIALFPQRSGVLTIPASSYSGRDVFVKGEEITLNVKAAAVSGWWLPANDLQIKSQLKYPEIINSGDVGEFIIELEAKALSAEQLPKLELKLPLGIKSHLSKIIMDNRKSSEGIIGYRKEIHLLNFKEAGEFNWQGLEIDWWNLKEKHLVKAKTEAILFKVNSILDTAIEKDNSPKYTPQRKQELYFIVFMIVLAISVIVYAIYKGFHYDYDMTSFAKAARGQDALKAWRAWHKLGLSSTKLSPEAQAELEKIRQSAFSPQFSPWCAQSLVAEVRKLAPKANSPTPKMEKLPQLNP